MERNNPTYIRVLELQAVISEEWGETVQELNNFIFKGAMFQRETEYIEKALLELRQIQSPIEELKSLLEIELRKRGKVADE
ncbi:hypothetical protein [Bacillus phage YungSlug]|nr:hypothetical protein [Bacillus phage YungSlug]